jgi:uncharacterized membrane protein YhhN
MWLVGLLILWALFLFGGFLFGTPDADGDRMPTWTTIASSFVLVASGWLWLLSNEQSSTRSISLLIALGMTLGFVGDLFMARWLRIGENRVLPGMIAFGLGHIAYIAALIRLGDTTNLNATGPRLGAWLAWLLIGAVAWYFVVFRGQTPTTLHFVALPYALLLASTVGFATALALQDRTFLPVALGATLFLLSDLILAAQLFNGLRFPLIGDVIWLTYGPGQMLIVYGIGAAIRIFPH